MSEVIDDYRDITIRVKGVPPPPPRRRIDWKDIGKKVAFLLLLKWLVS